MERVITGPWYDNIKGPFLVGRRAPLERARLVSRLVNIWVVVRNIRIVQVWGSIVWTLDAKY